MSSCTKFCMEVMKNRTSAVFLLVLSGILILSFFLSLAFGSVWIGWENFREVFSSSSSLTENIIVHIRLPRAAGAVLCGGALALAGAIIQSVLANPLAAGHSIGINGGAGFMVALCCAFLPAGMQYTLWASILGALLAAMLILFLALRFELAKTTVILAGVAIGQIFSAGIDLIVTLDSDALIGYSSFRIGGLANLTFARLLPGSVLIVCGLTAALLVCNQIEILSLGNETAQSLGLNARLWMVLLLSLAALLCAGAVSFAGLIGFVGLIVPHMIQRLYKGSMFTYLLGCFLGGAVLLLLCDLAGRILAAPYEIPAGILLSLLGGPYFLWLLFHRRGRRT